MVAEAHDGPCVFRAVRIASIAPKDSSGEGSSYSPELPGLLPYPGWFLTFQPVRETAALISKQPDPSSWGFALPRGADVAV